MLSHSSWKNSQIKSGFLIILMHKFLRNSNNFNFQLEEAFLSYFLDQFVPQFTATIDRIQISRLLLDEWAQIVGDRHFLV